MKKIFANRILALSIAIPLAVSASAQSSSANAATFDKTTLVSSVKANADFDKLALHNLSTDYSKVFRSFTRDFQNATNIDVSSDDASVFIYCVVDGIANRIMYSKGGKTERVIRTYDESKLDPNVLILIKSHYQRYSIFGITEVSTKGKTAYLVNLENDKMWKIIRVVDGEMDLYQEYTKS